MSCKASILCRSLAVTIVAGLFFISCNSVNDDVIPSIPVYLNLTSASLWNTYGVAGYGDYRIFVKELRQPSNFAYTEQTSTGFGGVLLVNGTNPFSLEAGVPMAYDLACPVERRSDVRISMQISQLFPVAVCPVCGSHFDVVERGGSPIDGPALADKLGLRRFECRQGAYGGFLIINY